MSLTLNPTSAKQADTINTAIKESGKYVGIITRAEELTSKNGNKGLGLSFKSDSGESADYLDLYIGDTDGKPWAGSNTVNAIMCCLKVKQANVGVVKVEKWNKEIKQRETVAVPGYPDIQGRRIGLLLQKELTEYQGKQQEKLNIYGVFQDGSELTASEILSSATKPEKLEKMVQSLMAKPIKDSRVVRTTTTSASQYNSENPANGFDSFDSDIPF